jgi:hypothetical protein
MDIFVFFLLLASVSINILLYWFIKGVFRRSSLLESRTTAVLNALEQYLSHLSAVHELREYYGDPQLNDLVEHTKEISENLQNYRNGFVFEIRGELVGDYDQEETQEE